MNEFEDLVSGVDAGLSNPCVVSFSAQPNGRTKEISVYPVKTQLEIPYGGSFDLNVSLDLTQTRGGKPEDYEISYELFGVDYFLMKDVSIGGGVLEKKEATPKDRVLAKYTSAVEVKPDTKNLTPIPVSARRGKLFLVVSVRRVEDGAIKKATIEGHILRNSEYDNSILDTGSAFREAVARALMQNGNLVVGENATVTDDESGVMKFRTNIDGEDVYAELYFVVNDSGGVQIKFAYKGKDSEEVTLHEADLLEMMSNAKGKDGKSAYDLWIEAGNEGSVDDFLRSLIGAQGPEGPKGDPGDKGDPGPQGDPGESAYDTWVAQGGVGDEAAFLASLKGDKGDTGVQGPPGADGADGEPGKSAYDVAVEEGYTGTEEEWATVQINAAQNATDAANSAAVAESYAQEAANSARSSIGVSTSYLLSRQAQSGAEWRYVATQLAGAGDTSTIEGSRRILDKIRQGKLCYPQFTTTGNWVLGQARYGDETSNFDTTTWEIVIDASSITTASVFLFDCLTKAFRRVFIFAPNMTKSQEGCMSNMGWIHELDGVFTKLTTSGDMFANKTRTHSMPWCAGKTIDSLVNINNFMKNNVALPADQFPIGLPNVTNAQDAFLNCTLLTQEVADAILNSLPVVEAGTDGKGTITFTGTAAATSWTTEGADLTAVNAATEKGWTVEY